MKNVKKLKKIVPDKHIHNPHFFGTQLLTIYELNSPITIVFVFWGLGPKRIVETFVAGIDFAQFIRVKFCKNGQK